MSNKIALATIQFRADAKGANVALDSLRASAADARKTIDEMQDALNRGIKTMKGADGVEFDVAAKLKSATKEARSFESAIHELMKGATALESVVKNIRMGEIEKSSRAELKGAINAAQSRLRPIREKEESGKLNEEDLQRQRELNLIIAESQKQLNRLDRDTEKVIETLKNGGTVAESVLKKEQDGLEKILAMIPKGTDEYKQYADQLKEIQTYVANIRKQEQTQATALLGEKNLGKYSEEQIRAAIQSARELIQTYKTASPEAKALADNIVRAEQHLKDYGIEAARAAAKETAQIKTQEEAEKQLRVTMNKRLTELPKLSAEALAETKKYWEAQRNGAEVNSKELARYEANLKKVMNQEQKRRVAQLDNVLTQPGQNSIAEVRTALAEMEKLRDSVRQGSAAWLHYNKMVEQGRAYLDGLDLSRITNQMNDLQHLSASGLAEVKKYWETMVAGAAQGSTELATYEAELKKVVTEEQRRAELQAQSKIGILSSGNLGQYSESQIRQAIEAGKQLIQTYKTADPAAQTLAKNIVAAEEHLKQYGLEAERTAVKEAEALKKAAKQRKETDDLMRQQLQQGTTLSQSALKAQEQYWQRLIDDPKTAAASLQEYETRLLEVQGLQRQKVREEGRKALNEFRTTPNLVETASADTLKKYTDQLKAYRDTLPKQANATVIAEIEGYLQKAGAAAKKAAEKTMSLRDAYRIGLQGLNGSFKGTNEQLKQAKKTLEDQLAVTDKGTKRYDQLRRALEGIALEENRIGAITKEVQATLDNPKGKSFNELKIAVEQGRAALASMRTETEADKKKFDELSAKVKECDIQMKTLGNSSKGTASAFDKAWSRLKTYVTLYVGAAVAMQKLTGTMGDLMELSDKMGEVRKTTGFTADEVGRLSDELKKLDTRTTITGLLDLSVVAGQLGLKTQEDVEGFTIAANKLMVALPEMGKEGATEMLKVALATGEIDKIRRQMEEGLIDGSSATAVAMEKVGSTIDRLRATSAATAPAITDFVKRVGAVGAQSGISIDQVAALGSTVDALGMRVEMSATALSRMVPAIKNNAFAIGQVIGKTEEYIRKQFAEGKGMNVILDIFDAINKSGKKSADDIEAMFGGSMQEIMKELNQQGARAGIVFAGLSQNVDELRRQLGVASKAYEENIAIQQEYNKMNETTAAKWERLKNEVEEMFVGDEAQRWLGYIVEGLRDLVNLISGNVKPALQWLSTTIRTLITMWAVFKLGLGEGIFYKLAASIKSLGQSIALMVMYTKDYLVYQWQLIRAKDEDARASIRATMAQKGLNKEMMANVWGAVATAIVMAVYKLYEYIKASKEAAAEAGRFNQKIYEEQQALNKLFEPLNKSNLAQEERSKLISEINSKYSKYLGYMLSETSSAVQLADAHALIAKRIKEEAYERRIAEQEKKVQEAHDEDVNAAYAKMTDRLRSGARGNADAQAMADMLKGVVDNMMGQIKYAYDDSDNIFKARTNYYLDPKVKAAIDNGIDRLVVDGKLSRDNVQLIQKAVYKYTVEAKSQHDEMMKTTANVRSDLRNIQGAIQNDLTRSLNGLVNNMISFAKQQSKPAPQQTPGPWAPQPQQQGNTALTPFWQQGGQQQAGGWNGGWGTGGQQQAETIQRAPKDWKPNIDEKDVEQVRQFVKDQEDLRGAIAANAKNMSEDMKDIYESWKVSETELDRLRKLVADADKKNEPGGGGNPYGNFTVMDSYDKWSADALVDRKKQMLQYVKAMANGADVQAILSQDKKFMDEATRKGIKNVRDAIEWYNTERLKIQEELADRHLTNEGGWANPAKAKSRRPRQPMSESAVAQLEEYYAWRKEEVERQRTEEGISEAEFNRRMESLEQEHLQKRADLRKSFTSQDKQYVEQFRKWWASVRELDEVEWELIDAEWKVAIKRDRDYNEMKAAKDLSAMRAIVVKQLNAIEDIIAKERPFNGITDNLEANLTKMGILFADLDKMKAKALAEGKDTSAIDALYGTDRSKRLSFILGESEDSFSSTVEEVMARMGKAGMEAWAEEIRQSPKMQEALMAQLHQTYDAIQEAIKKEASLMKKQAETMWNNILLPGGEGKTTVKDAFEQTIAQLGVDQGRVSRANSMIGAGTQSERVADKLAIKQMQLQLTMQQHYYNLIEKQGRQRIKDLERSIELAKELGDVEKQKRLEQDKEHVEMSLRLALTKEQTEELKLQEDIIAKTEESQNRLYTQLKEWGELIASSLQSVFEASNAGNAEYYNELAKMNLTGKGGPGAGTYVVIDNAGTEDAKAHYEYLDERAALERQHEIEQENAQAEAWKKVMDDINMKMSDQITDWLNASLQQQALDTNTNALGENTKAIYAMIGAMGGSTDVNVDISGVGGFPKVDSNNPDTWGYAARKRGGMNTNDAGGTDEMPTPSAGEAPASGTPMMQFPTTPEQVENIKANMEEVFGTYRDLSVQAETEKAEMLAEIPNFTKSPISITDEDLESLSEKLEVMNQMEIDKSDEKTAKLLDNQKKVQQGELNSGKQMSQSSKNMYASMIAAANLYGVAYQTVTNDNLSASQKFETIALQAAGQSAIAMLQTKMFKSEGDVLVSLPELLANCLNISPIAGAAIFAVLSALLGAAIGTAVSNMNKKKSEIAQVTGASASAGRLSTGMLTYAEGNVNEFTDPGSLTPGRQYNVDGADGRTYRARYMGSNPKTHLTNGPEFHLAGERGREMIIDAGTTRQITMNEGEIWHAIQTLSSGGRMAATRRRGRGVRAFADGNVEDFEEVSSTVGDVSGESMGGFSPEMAAQMQASLDRNSEVMERVLQQGIHAYFDVYGKDGVVHVYDSAKKTLSRHGERY